MAAHTQTTFVCFSARGMPGCPCPGIPALAGQSSSSSWLLPWSSWEGLGAPSRPSGPGVAACRLDNKEVSPGGLLSGEKAGGVDLLLLGSLMVGLSGVFPLLVIPLEMGTTLRSEGE